MAEPCAAVRHNTFDDHVTAAEEWYAIQVTPRHEKKVASLLDQKRLTTFLPLVEEVHYWSDRNRRVQIPLFAGYTFVRFGRNEQRIAILRTPGVSRLVGKDYVGSPIPDKQIEDVWTLVNSQLRLDPHPFVRVGDRVRILSGSLQGVEGILARKNADATLVVSIELLQRSVAVRIDGFSVERIVNGAGSHPPAALAHRKLA